MLLHLLCLIGHSIVCVVLYRTVLQYIIVLYWIVLYCNILYCIVLYCIVLYCIELYYIAIDCIVFVLYCIVLYGIVLYCIVWYCVIIALSGRVSIQRFVCLPAYLTRALSCLTTYPVMTPIHVYSLLTVPVRHGAVPVSLSVYHFLSCLPFASHPSQSQRCPVCLPIRLLLPFMSTLC